jgi:hypothetical protein
MIHFYGRYCNHRSLLLVRNPFLVAVVVEAEIRILNLTLFFKMLDANLLRADLPLSLSLLESFFHGMDDVRQHLDTVNSPTASETDVFSFKLVIYSGAGKDSRSTVRKKSDVTCV